MITDFSFNRNANETNLHLFANLTGRFEDDTSYDLKIQNGAITKVTPTTTIAVDTVPELRVRSSTGIGVLLSANIDERPDYQGEVEQVIDCIS